MFKIYLFSQWNIDEEYKITWPWKWRSRSFQGHVTRKLLNEVLVSHYEYVSLKVGLSAILHDLTLPIIAHLHQLWDIGVGGGIGV